MACCHLFLNSTNPLSQWKTDLILFFFFWWTNIQTHVTKYSKHVCLSIADKVKFLFKVILFSSQIVHEPAPTFIWKAILCYNALSLTLLYQPWSAFSEISISREYSEVIFILNVFKQILNPWHLLLISRKKSQKTKTRKTVSLFLRNLNDTILKLLFETNIFLCIY